MPEPTEYSPPAIDWLPPEPRPGLLGEWDKFIGPGTTLAENLLILVPSVVAAVALPIYASSTGLDWTWWQALVAGVLALDVTGGVTANATTAAKRWYHRPGQGWPEHMGFIAIHFVHPLLVVLVFGGSTLWFGAIYGWLLLASVIVLASPRYLQRPVALLLYLVALLVAAFVESGVPGFGWLVPALFLKLLVAHLVPEAPFAPPVRG